jgi:hypothetical protein
LSTGFELSTDPPPSPPQVFHTVEKGLESVDNLLVESLVVGCG